MKITRLLGASLCIIFLNSCGGANVLNDCSDVVALNSLIADETQKLSSALSSFSTDQSSANCSNLENAYIDYIDALEDFQGCADDLGLGNEFRTSISEARSELTDSGC